MSILELKGLRVSYGNVEVIHGIDMAFKQEAITAIIGSNGAGKTTLINTISGILPYSGEILYEGKAIEKKANRIVKSGIVQVPEGRKVFAGLSVEENLRLGAYSVAGGQREQALFEAQYDLFPRLRERKNQDAGTLSGGEQQMLAIARGLMARPRILMLDEPSLGLAPIIVNDVFAIIKQVAEQGITVILVEQNANMSLNVCDYAYVLENGEVVLSGDGNEVAGNARIKQAYLGIKKKEI